MLTPAKSVYLIGSASGLAAADKGCGDGPIVLEQSPYFAAALKNKHINYHWLIIHQAIQASANSLLSTISQHCEKLAHEVAQAMRNKQFFTVLGGDHSCAIGTWSGALSVLKDQGDMGLIWIDAHMDSHTPETSLTGNFHGMPLACLLGKGDPSLVNMMGMSPKIKPQHLCLIGIRSYEEGEENLLTNLNVRIFYMDEIRERGLDAVMTEAIQIVTKGTAGYGITIDIDSIDPLDAPGTGVSEPNGLAAEELCRSLRLLVNDQRLIGAEIVEFDPHLDKDNMTEKWVGKLLAAIIEH